MMLFRRAEEADLNTIYQLAEQSGVGLTSLPNDKKFLAKRMRLSEKSFQKNIVKPRQEYYWFVLEDTSSSKIIGTSAIEAITGYDLPFYAYKISHHTNVCIPLHLRTDYALLTLVNDYQGKSELGSLYLDPRYRRHGNGPLLSRARFLFIAQFPERFASTLIAEMRGISDKFGRSPFWESLGQHFFQISFEEADQLTFTHHKQFIADLMPKHPIYVPLLTQQAQAVIGKPHELTRPAMAMLQREGFIFNDYIDIFDAGPILEAPLNHINTIVSSDTFEITNISDQVSGDDYFISNTQLNFRATMGHTVLDSRNHTCIISKKTAHLLQVSIGESLRIAPRNNRKNSHTTSSSHL